MFDWGVLGGLLFVGLLVVLYPLRHKKALAFVLLPASAAFLLVGYLVWGHWFEWQGFKLTEKKQREAKQVIQALGSTEAIVERLRARISEMPKDAKAWFLLGRVYGSTGDWQHASEAYVMAHGLEAENHEYSLHYAQSMWELNHNAFDDKTRLLLHVILKQNPKQPDALAMLAFDAYSQHHYQDAVRHWERLLELIETSSEEAGKIRQAIAKARQGV
jgi:cytochrome c-type biogenesis protein CcmH